MRGISTVCDLAANSQRVRVILILQLLKISALLLTTLITSTAFAEPGATFHPTIPEGLRGPFVANPAVMVELDCPDGACSGPLEFARLVQARASTSRMTDRGVRNPFNLKVAAQIAKYIEQDLDDLARQPDVSGHQVKKDFLTDPDSRVELVGAINRMDRQFIKDPNLGLTKQQLDCGEVSLIYRFGYSLRDREQKSRLPITLNLVFPALPSNDRNGTITCKTMAQRWLDAVPGIHALSDSPPAVEAKRAATSLMDPKLGPLAFINGKDILRIELNIQAYRKPAGIVKDFGTEAAYVIRVFKWLPEKGYFDPDILRNQIDRDKVLCRADKPADCAANEARRKQLLAYLSRPDILPSIDWGTLEVDYGLGILSKRGLSVSPGGAHRSLNQPFWNAGTKDEQVISDAEIEAILRFAEARNIKFSFIKSVADFRTRLNESSCTGCHQTRAIAGFHFPGSDREGTSPVNAVLLPGSPQFYGDQPRRLEIVTKIANGQSPKLFDLAIGYAGRPMNRFASPPTNRLTDRTMNRFTASLQGTQLLGGWGGACISAEDQKQSQRQWNCQPEYECVRLNESANNNMVGTCVPKQTRAAPPATMAVQIGDALQRGRITTAAFGKDKYKRIFPNDTGGGETRILPAALPPNPPDNSYYGAHQEYYLGTPGSDDKIELRDAMTGGFPGGMLRLSECIGLPNEATCGLIASTGFNACVENLGSHDKVDGKAYTIDACFQNFTSYAGLRACSAGTPCRDDYICVKPMNYSSGQYDQRRAALLASKVFQKVNGKKYDPDKLFGQVKPDEAWAARGDTRGLCIPPYFVFQFRADGHPAPK